MKALRSVVTAFQMFSRLPMPRVKWEEDNMRYMLPAFPLVGLAIGALTLLLRLLCAHFNAPALLRGAAMTILPILVTGGIHLDGFADTVDALSSYADPARKREILKDPHAGAFAVIYVGVYLVAALALNTTMKADLRTSAALTGMFALSRAVSGLCSLAYPGTDGRGLLSTFRASADKRLCLWLLSLWVVGLIAALTALCGARGLLLPLAAGLAAARLYRICVKQFGGMSGDLSGYFLALAELFMLAAINLGGI